MSSSFARVRRARQEFFWDDKAIFDMGLTPFAMIVRAYLCCCADSNTSQAYPSLKHIAKKCGIARSTVQKAIDELINRGLLAKENRWKPDCNEQMSCLYTILPAREEEGVPLGGMDCKPLNRIPVPSSGKKQDPITIDQEEDDPFPHADPVINCALYWSRLTSQLIGGPVVERLSSYLDDGMTPDLIREIMHEAVVRGKHRLDYVYGIANNCLSHGVTTVEQWRDAVARFEEDKKLKNKRRKAARDKETDNFSQEDYEKALSDLLGEDNSDVT